MKTPLPPAAAAPQDPLSAGALCTRIVTTVRDTTPLVDAARSMRADHVGCVVVTEVANGGDVPVGILTDRDIVVSVVAVGIAPSAFTVAEVMTRRPVVVQESDSLGMALVAMRQHGVRRLPVISEQGWLVGLLSLDDLVAAVTLQTQALTDCLVAGRLREGESRP